MRLHQFQLTARAPAAMNCAWGPTFIRLQVVECGNPECGKVTCRECKEDSHQPLTCQVAAKFHPDFCLQSYNGTFCYLLSYFYLCGSVFTKVLNTDLIWGRDDINCTCVLQEVEKDSETKARTKLENVMTEAMLRTCPSCQKRSAVTNVRTDAMLRTCPNCQNRSVATTVRTEAMLRTCPSCQNRSCQAAPAQLYPSQDRKKYTNFFKKQRKTRFLVLL